MIWPAPPTARTGGTNHEEALRVNHLPPTTAGGAGLGLRPRLGARAAATGAPLPAGDGDLLARTGGGLFEADGQVEPEIGPTAWPTGTAAPPEAEDVAEDVAEVAEDVVKATEAREPAVAHPLVAESVVGPPLVAVRQDLVGLGGLLEAILRLGVVRVAIGVVLDGELSVRALDLRGVRVPRDAEDFVVVSLGHGLPSPHAPGGRRGGVARRCENRFAPRGCQLWKVPRLC